MDIINSIKHKHLGEINCYRDEKGYPLMWGKEEKLRVFSESEEEILVCFDFYCFNKEFQHNNLHNDIEAEKIQDNISRVYGYMRQNIEKAEETFLHYYHNYFFEEFDVDLNRYDSSIHTVSDLYPLVQAREIRVHEDSFSVIIASPWTEDKIGIMIANIFSGEMWSSVNSEYETEIVEMDYE